MKNKIFYIVTAAVIVIALAVTLFAGLRVGLRYSEGYTIGFSEENGLELQDVREILNDVFKDKEYLIQRVEFFDDTVLVKVREVNEEELTNLANKLNEKYGSEYKASDLGVEHVSNVKLRTLIEPYIMPIGLTTLIILGWFAIRYRGAKQMLELVKWWVIVEGILYSIYAICRAQVDGITMPLALSAYILTVLAYTTKTEMFSKNK